MKIPTTRTNARMYDNFYNAHLHVCTHACTQACTANPTSHILANIPSHPLYRKTTSERVRFGLTLGVSVSKILFYVTCASRNKTPSHQSKI